MVDLMSLDPSTSANRVGARITARQGQRGDCVRPCRSLLIRVATATWRSGYATVCKTVYPGSIPGVASKLIESSSQALRRQTSFAAVDQIGPHIEGEAAR